MNTQRNGASYSNNRNSYNGNRENISPLRSSFSNRKDSYQNSVREVSRTISVKKLHRNTLANTLMNYFDKFGVVEEVNLDEDLDGNLSGKATIVFKKVPNDPARIKGIHKIDGVPVQVEFINNLAHEPYNYNSNTNQSKLHSHCFSMGCMKSPKEFIEQWKTTRDVKFVVNYSFRRVNIFFSHLDEEYKLEYRFKDVLGDMDVERAGNTTYFTIQLRYPPYFWKRNNNFKVETSKACKRGKKWERIISIPLRKGVEIPTKSSGPFLPIPPPNCINIGDWITYRLEFRPPPRFVENFERELKEAAKSNLVPHDLDNLKPFITVIKAEDLPKPYGHAERSRLKIEYKVLYMLECAISYYFLNEYNLTKEFYDILEQIAPDFAYECLQLIIMGKEKIWDPIGEFKSILSKKKYKIKNRPTIPKHCAMLRKVLISPTRLYIQQPTLETTNRVVRNFEDQTDNFMRIQFTDEGFNRVGPDSVNSTKTVIFNRIFDVLKKGIQIGTKRYEFLAFSSSQLREHGCWVFAPTKDLTANDIRQWMGVFSHEKVVAKHAVRMGQCFSSTIPILTLDEHDVEFIDDVKRHGYTFSDGVGRISESLAQEVALHIGLKVVPSAFQFRLGGAKGVLTIHKELDKKNIKVQLRPSQKKFDSRHLTLEIIRTATYIHGYLNRQVITILSALGVPDEIFMAFMTEMVQDVNKLFQKPEEAIRILLSNADESGTSLAMISSIQAGFLERGDPFIKNLLNLFRVNVLKDLKKKAKIIVPKGAYLLGVMDETNTLEEGEVFVQICDTSNNLSHKQIITGEVVVFRNPCFHPGDVRTATAVDRENLRHLVDVIVFSSKGYRDIPSMCSGGDLDGDDYTVYWDPRLFPKKLSGPMDYTASSPKEVESQVEIKDIIKFFVNYINNDNLGQIANAHLATADQSATGARDGRCIRLAQLHSEAVDFPKSGKAALLSPDLIVRKFPDFMQKKDKQSYKSEKVLGHIFRAIDKSDYKDYQSKLIAETKYDNRMIVPDMELYIVEARELRAKYNRDLLALMNQFGVQTEAEIISGYVIKWLKKGKSKSRYEQHDYTMKAVKKLQAAWRKTFESEFLDGSKTLDLSKQPLLDAKAAAWYYVTYHPSEREKDPSIEGGFFSFTWSILEYVCEIAKRNNHCSTLNDELAKIDEEKIISGNKRLLEMRHIPIIIEDDDDDDDDDDDYASTSSDESEEEYMYLDPSSNNQRSAPRNNQSSRRNTDRNNNHHTVLLPTAAAPAETQQSRLTADATEDDLVEALLGLQ